MVKHAQCSDADMLILGWNPEDFTAVKAKRLQPGVCFCNCLVMLLRNILQCEPPKVTSFICEQYAGWRALLYDIRSICLDGHKHYGWRFLACFAIKWDACKILICTVTAALWLQYTILGQYYLYGRNSGPYEKYWPWNSAVIRFHVKKTTRTKKPRQKTNSDI